MQTVTTQTKKAGKLASTKHVDAVIRNYKQERWIHNSERIGKEDSLSAWWSIEEMENFIATAKEQGADGLKFYFGAYGNEYAKTPEYSDRQTLVMVGTKEAETNLGVKNKDIYVQTSTGSNILANCNAVMCPPKCGGIGPDTFDVDTLGVTIIDRGEKGILVF